MRDIHIGLLLLLLMALVLANCTGSETVAANGDKPPVHRGVTVDTSVGSGAASGGGY